MQNIDVLTLTNAAFRQVYGTAYLDLVNHAPHVLGYFYDLMDQPRGPARNARPAAAGASSAEPARGSPSCSRRGTWDVVVNTHFLPAEIIAALRARGSSTLPQVTVTTDFETHRLWVNQPCDLYFTATEEGAAYLATGACRAEHVRVTGIPIHPVFAQAEGPRRVPARSRACGGDRPVVLQLAGGFGVGPIEKLFRSLLDVERRWKWSSSRARTRRSRSSCEQVEVPAAAPREGARLHRRRSTS